MTKFSTFSTIESPQKDLQSLPKQGNDWMVTVYDNDKNTYEEVMFVLMLSTNCDEEEAYIEAWEIDHFGACVVHRAEESECRSVSEVIATIGIAVEATPSS